jgi:hypothetical protein
MTFCNKGSPINWSKEGGGKVTLSKRALLNKRAALSRELAF